MKNDRLHTARALLLVGIMVSALVGWHPVVDQYFAGHESIAEPLESSYGHNDLPATSVAVNTDVASSPDAVATLRQALNSYRAMAREGEWPTILDGQLLREGEASPRVVHLRERLARTGDLPLQEDTGSLLFDGALDRAVRAFQRRHGLVVDGIVGPSTVAALNVPLSTRIRQLEINLQRRQAQSRWGSSYVMVNIPAYELQLVVDGQLHMQKRVIVGTTRTPTPVFETQLTHVILAPYWNVPTSIAERDILPRARQDPTYLQRNGYERLPNNRLRQRPGPQNQLGRIKYHVPNPYSIGLHDTPARHLYAYAERAYSSGCVRLEDPLELAEYLLQGTEWTRARMQDVINQNQERWITLSSPIPLHVVYWTAWAEPDGTVHFRKDLYGHDTR